MSGFVGVFDSGVGGISVLRSLVAELPHEDFHYFGDSANAPYGEKTEARVLEALRRASEGRTVLSVSHRVYENLGGRTIEIRPQPA